MVIELREAMYDKMFDLVDEAMLYGKKQKMVLCALEDAMYDCYEEIADEVEDSDDSSEYDELSKNSNNDEEVNFKRSMRAMRRNMRHNDDSVESAMRLYGHRTGMRSRRNRMGRFV